jgi:hypothetical protein
MNKRYLRHHNRELGTVWFVVPLLAICATLLVLLLFSRPASFAETQRAQPYAGSDPSLPAAAAPAPHPTAVRGGHQQSFRTSRPPPSP